MDGVLADIHTITLTEISAEIQQVLTLNLVTEWDWSPAGFRGSIIDRWQNFWRDHSGESVQPHERDLETITRRIRNRFGGLDVVTQHSELERKNIKWWLREHRVQYDKLVLVGLRGKENLPYVVYIDDNPLLAQKLANGPKLLFLYDQPWNRMISNNIRNIRRIRCLREVLE